MRTKDYGEFDFIYSLGLFDYLKEQYAVNLVNKMWGGLKSGGSILIANLNNNAANIAYCEAIMDWWMIQRSEEELSALADSLKDYGSVDNIEVVTIGCFSYLLATKS